MIFLGKFFNKKNGRYCGHFTNQFGKQVEIRCTNLKEVKSALNTALMKIEWK